MTTIDWQRSACVVRNASTGSRRAACHAGYTVARNEITTASFTARPTPAAPPEAVMPL